MVIDVKPEDFNPAFMTKIWEPTPKTEVVTVTSEELTLPQVEVPPPDEPKAKPRRARKVE